MTVLVWDKPGDRRFQTGVDRGVLYPPNGPAVPWNGLTSVAENLGREVKSYYSDGIKYLDHEVIGAYSAKLAAFTYPDELDELVGVSAYAPGVFLHDQRSHSFHITYRTREGDDLDPERAYRIHVVYNVLATPSDTTMNTLADSISLSPFEWTLQGTPPAMLGAHPTCHISLHSRLIDSDALETLEGLLYGTESTSPDLPSAVDLLALAQS